MHNEGVRHITMVNEESFKLTSISAHKWALTQQHILKYRMSHIFTIEKCKDFTHDISIVEEDNKMYIYTKQRSVINLIESHKTLEEKLQQLITI